MSKMWKGYYVPEGGVDPKRGTTCRCARKAECICEHKEYLGQNTDSLCSSCIHSKVCRASGWILRCADYSEEEK